MKIFFCRLFWWPNVGLLWELQRHCLKFDSKNTVLEWFCLPICLFGFVCLLNLEKRLWGTSTFSWSRGSHHLVFLLCFARPSLKSSLLAAWLDPLLLCLILNLRRELWYFQYNLSKEKIFNYIYNCTTYIYIHWLEKFFRIASYILWEFYMSCSVVFYWSERILKMNWF